MKRNDWNAVYANQRKILKALWDVEELILGGGTAVQCYTIPQKYRESEDLDLFADHEMGPKESAKIKRELVSKLRQSGIAIESELLTEQGTHRISCAFEENEEVIKIELLDFTAQRFGDLAFVVHSDFPRIENNYNLLLYKLKALCDRSDTIKDLFDLYFILTRLAPVDIKGMLSDLRQKFEETTGYIYSEKELIAALSVKNRNWDIVPTEITERYWHDLQTAVDEFRQAFLRALIDPEVATLDFTYKSYLKRNAELNGVTEEEFLDIFEMNPFIEMECRTYLNSEL
ncbi:MAG: nucleotidyl transferase AbiEii/AbiGii toxin family protein [Campylobacterales bacterium]|nr:nucleotidyl transferase AbiEii/AbiGii toxin family protein [Campylobacterales bacterium]